MGGTGVRLEARTKTELRSKATAWLKDARNAGLDDIRQGWDPDHVTKGKDGLYRITLLAHT